MDGRTITDGQTVCCHYTCWVSEMVNFFSIVCSIWTGMGRIRAQTISMNGQKRRFDGRLHFRFTCHRIDENCSKSFIGYFHRLNIVRYHFGGRWDLRAPQNHPLIIITHSSRVSNLSLEISLQKKSISIADQRRPGVNETKIHFMLGLSPFLCILIRASKTMTIGLLIRSYILTSQSWVLSFLISDSKSKPKSLNSAGIQFDSKSEMTNGKMKREKVLRWEREKYRVHSNRLKYILTFPSVHTLFLRL